MGFRLTPKEQAQIEAHRRRGELFSECVRRLLLDATKDPPKSKIVIADQTKKR